MRFDLYQQNIHMLAYQKNSIYFYLSLLLPHILRKLQNYITAIQDTFFIHPFEDLLLVFSTNMY